MDIKELLKHHNDDSIKQIDKDHTKAEILQCLRDCGWRYSSAINDRDEANKKLSDSQSDLNVAKRMIMAFMGKPTRKENDYGGFDECYKKEDLLSLIGELFSVSSASKLFGQGE